MENILTKIINDAAGSKYQVLRKAAQEAQEVLMSEQSNHSMPTHELRDKCLGTLELAMDSNHSRLLQHALEGLQFIIRDNQLHSLTNATEKPEHTLPVQMLHTLHNLPALHADSDAQCHCFTIILQLVASSNWQISSAVISEIIELSISTVICAQQLSVRMAARATVSQVVNSYCSALYKEQAEDAADGDFDVVFEEIILLAQFIADKLETISSSPENSPALLLVLDSLLAVLASQPVNINRCRAFTDLMWQKISPCLISLLGNPSSPGAKVSSSANSNSANDDESGEQHQEIGRGFESIVGDQMIFGAPDIASDVYNITIEVLRILGSMFSMRSVVESLFHRMLIYPPPTKRLIALKCLKKLLCSPGRIIDLLTTYRISDKGPLILDCELSTWKIILDSLVECCFCATLEVSVTAVECTKILLHTLELICKDDNSEQLLSAETAVDQVNQRFPTMKDANSNAFDYTPKNVNQPRKPFMLPQRSSEDQEHNQDVTHETAKVAAQTASDQQRTINPTKTGAIVKGNNIKEAAPVPSATEDATKQSILSPTDPDDVDDYMAKVSQRISTALQKYQTGDSVEHFEKSGLSQSSATNKTISISPDGYSDELTKEAKNSNAADVQQAALYLKELKTRLPHWTQLKSSIEIDEVIQQFASEFCRDLLKEEEKEEDIVSTQGLPKQQLATLNADAIYFTTYCTLSLCYRLRMFGWYGSTLGTSRGIPISKKTFVDAILKSGCLIVASEAWVSTIYDRISEADIFRASGRLDLPSDNSHPIFWLIEDFDGSSNQTLSDVWRLENITKSKEKSKSMIACIKLIRWMVTASWSGMQEILSVMIENVRQIRPLHSLVLAVSKSAARHEQTLLSDGVTASLEGFQKLANLCIVLGLQSRCGFIFNKLVETACPLDEIRSKATIAAAARNAGSQQGMLKRMSDHASAKTPPVVLQIPHVLSMDIILNNAMEVGMHAPDCWKHIVRCCEYISELEHTIFTANNAGPNKQSTKPIQKASSVAAPCKANKRSKGSRSFDEETAGPDFVHLQNLPSSLLASDSVAGILKSCEKEGQLNTYNSAKLLAALSAKVDRLFESMGRSLNLAALVHFLDALICASQTQVFYTIIPGRMDVWTNLQRMSDLLLLLAKSRRPFAHLMRVWAIASPHLIEAACAKQPAVQNKAISLLHSCIVQFLLVQQQELDYFHFNESLFLPLQTIVCLEICHLETQDLIVCIINEFVDSYADEIRSGWRPLFMALKAIRTTRCRELNSDQATHLHSAICDVFNVFLKPSNLDIFCLAAVDCISCLLRYLRETDLSYGMYSEDETRVNPEEIAASDPVDVALDLPEQALMQLMKVNKLLATLYQMPEKGNETRINLLQKIPLADRSKIFVDPKLPTRAESLPSLAIELSYSNIFETEFSGIFLEQGIEDSGIVDKSNPWRNQTSSLQRILQLWFNLVEGLVGGVALCPRSLQPKVIQSLYSVIDSMKDVPGASFGAYCINHLVLPMMQNWLRREAHFTVAWRENKPSVRNFKQCVGLVTELVVDYALLDIGSLRHLLTIQGSETTALLLKQMLDLLVECIAQPSEIVSRLGCSCLKHLINSTAKLLTKSGWDLICKYLWRACCVTLYQLRVLMTHFQVGSNSFYGDLGQVQVALRKDTNPNEATRLRILAQQVFLLDSQKYSENLEENPDNISQSYRSVVFLLHPQTAESKQNPEFFIVRLPFRDIVVSLLSHQLLLQLTGSILLAGTSHVVSGASSLLMREVMSEFAAAKTSTSSDQLPGHMPRLTSEQVSSLLLCLDASFHLAYEFDQRPGLKFLLQKVFNSTVAANLYKQAVTAWTFRVITQLELSLKFASLSASKTSAIAKAAASPAASASSANAHCKFYQANSPVIESAEYYLHELVRSYWNLCQVFTALETLRLGGDSYADNVCEEPLVFLVAPQTEAEESISPRSGKSNECSLTTTQPAEGQMEMSQAEPPSGQTVNAAVSQQIKRRSVDIPEGNAEEPQTPLSDSDSDISAGDYEETNKLPEETVYSVATSDRLSEVVSNYRKQKAKATLPSSNSTGSSTPLASSTREDSQRKNPFDRQNTRQNSGADLRKRVSQQSKRANPETAEDEVEQEKEQSIVKDGEACGEAWSEMVTSLLLLLQRLPPAKFRSLLPAVFPSYSLLTAQCSQQKVRRVLADVLCQIADVYKFNEDSPITL